MPSNKTANDEHAASVQMMQEETSFCKGGHLMKLCQSFGPVQQAFALLTCFDSEGISTHVGYAQRNSSPSPWPLRHTVMLHIVPEKQISLGLLVTVHFSDRLTPELTGSWCLHKSPSPNWYLLARDWCSHPQKQCKAQMWEEGQGFGVLGFWMRRRRLTVCGSTLEIKRRLM